MAFLKECRVVLFDCDGVLWRGTQVLPGAVDVIKRLRQKGKKIAFVTNNNSITRLGLQKKLRDRGFNADLEECFCTSFIAAKYLSEKTIPGRVYMVGNKAMSDELNNFGIQHFGFGVDHYSDEILFSELPLPEDSDVRAVLVGYDRNLSVKKIAYAMTYLSNPETKFIATNTDAVFPMKNGKLFPGTGAIVASITTPSNREPIVVGKPNPEMFNVIADCLNINKDETVMIGDRLDTDILFAAKSGIKSVLLYSGVTDKMDVAKFIMNGSKCDGIYCHPDLILDDIASFISESLI